jgi:MFS transporter, SET family, sugar efflux transporter
MTTPAPPQADASAGGWVRTLVPLGVASTIVGLTQAFVFPFMALFLHDVIRASPAQTSLFLFLAALSAVLVGNAVGRVSDRPGARPRILVGGALAGIAGFATYAGVRNYWILLAVALTMVAASGSLMPQIFAFGREILDHGHPTRAMMGMNWLRMMLSLAWAAGAPVAALLLGLIGYTGLFIATAVAHLVILGLMTTLKQPGAATVVTGTAATATAVQPAPAPPTGAEPGKGMLIGSAAAFVALQCVTSLTVTTMPLFVSVDLHSSVRSAGLVLGLCAALEIPLMMVFGSFASRWPLRRLLLLGCGFGIAYTLVVSLSDAVWQVAVAQVLHACYVCAIGGIGISYFQQLLPSALGRATTLFTNAGRVSGMLAGLIFGVVEAHGYRLAYVASLGLSLAGTAILAATRGGAPVPAHQAAPA